MIAVSSLMTGMALLAVLVALAAVRGRGDAPVVTQLAALYRLLAILLICRLFAPLADGAALVLVITATMLTAAWLPLMGLRLVEELCRRHAPHLVKIAALSGAIGFSVVALTIGLVWSRAAIIALAAFQTIGVATMAAFILAHRHDLPRTERATADTFLIALVATIPLALTDFVAIFPELPLRGGSFAMLLMLLATSRVSEGDGAPRRLLTDVALCAGGGGIVALASGYDVTATGLGIGLTALALLIERHARGRARDDSLIAAMAASGAGSDVLLVSHPLLAGGRLIDDATLASYPPASLAALAQHRLISDATPDAEARDAARDILAAHGATHLLRLSTAPLRFLAVSAGSFAGQRVEDELKLVARLIEARA